MPTFKDDAAPAPEKRDFFGLAAAEVDSAVQQWGLPKFRGKQLRDWVYTKGITDPARMTNLSPADRTRLSRIFSFTTAHTIRDQQSSDGTLKLLLGWHPDGTDAVSEARGVVYPPTEVVAETVMIPDADRRTACVSSQVGCPVGCRFCASGIGGVKRSLTAAQIVEQVVALNARMNDGQPATARRQTITNIVFMGMGEPLANYAHVVRAIRVLHDPAGLNIGARKITVSTVGVPSKMRELAGEQLPINLAISLHAPDEALRKQLIPWAEHFTLPDILDAARYYFDRTGREITLEYILLAGVNDRPAHARQLAAVCRTLRSNVNLIRYNEVAGLPFGRPAAADVVAFQETLREAGVNAHIRRSRGRDIDAACGQLRRKETSTAGQLVTLGRG